MFPGLHEHGGYGKSTFEVAGISTVNRIVFSMCLGDCCLENSRRMQNDTLNTLRQDSDVNYETASTERDSHTFRFM